MKRILIAVAILGAIAATFFGYQFYVNMFSVNTPLNLDEEVLLIPEGSTLEDVIDSLVANGQIVHENRFRWTAGKMDYDDETLKRGRYIVSPGQNSKDLISKLRGGKQTPLKLTIHNVRTIEQLSARVGDRLEFDSTDLMQYFMTRFDSLAGTTPETRLTRFLPNTYEFYWTISPEDFAERMIKEHDRFWTEEKREKARQIGLTTEEVYTLASIIEKETNYDPEKPRMAGVYLNRLQQGIPLQADPTIVFALGDFSIKRVLYGHLEIDSPYNTYRNAGLPPGPIFMPGIASIDAVLNREENDFLYFCARPSEDGPGHAYASTLPAHNQNARRYQQWLNSRGIY